MTEDSVFYCAICLQSLKDKDALSDHLRISHMDKIVRDAIRDYIRPIYSSEELDEMK